MEPSSSLNCASSRSSGNKCTQLISASLRVPERCAASSLERAGLLRYTCNDNTYCWRWIFLLVLFISTFLFSGCQKESEKQSAGKDAKVQNVEGGAAKEELNREIWDAVINKNVEKARSMLEKGADVNARAYGGWTPLMRAVSDGNIEISKLLIERGADVDAREDLGNPILLFACRKDRVDILSLLLEKGAAVNVKNAQGEPALSVAASYGIEVVGPLVERGADVNAQDNDGKTPLMVAAVYGRADIVKFFIEKGADVNARTKSGATVLGLMRPYIGHEMVEVRKDLISAGARE